jgi:hypothetical protein
MIRCLVVASLPVVVQACAHVPSPGSPPYTSHGNVHVVAIRASHDLCKMDKVGYEEAVAQLARMNLMKAQCGCLPETRQQIIALNAAPWERWNMLELELSSPIRFEVAPIVRSRMLRKWTVGSDILALGMRHHPESTLVYIGMKRDSRALFRPLVLKSDPFRVTEADC